jgi:ketosteroid isomerase-like protein
VSRESVNVVEAAYAVLADSGLEAFAGYWADEIEWRAIGGSWRGRDAGLAYMQAWLDLFEDFITEPVEVIDGGGDHAVIWLRYSGRLKRSGMEVPPEYFAILIEVRDGKMVRAREYATRDEAVDASASPERA